MDAEFNKEQIGTLFVWVGALEGRFGGGGSHRDVHPRMFLPKKYTFPGEKIILVGVVHKWD